MGAVCEVRYKEVLTVYAEGGGVGFRTRGGVVVGQTVQPVQAWKKGRYKLFD